MTTRSWIRNLFARPVTRTIRNTPRPSRPALETLEDRWCPSAITVLTNGDGNGVLTSTGPGTYTAPTLRAAIAGANTLGGAETITFDPIAFATPQIITLNRNLGQLELSDTTGTETITGPAAGLTISGNNASRVFLIDAGASAALSGLTITDGGQGIAGIGGGILNNGTLALSDCTVSGNTANYGAGIYTTGALTVENCTISHNNAGSPGLAGEYGGGVYVYSGSVLISNSIISCNSTAHAGGGLFNNNGTVTLTDSTISGNTGNSGAGLGNLNGSTTLTDCTVSGNIASSSGGGIANFYGTATVTNCTISGNTAGINGGGISSPYTATTALTNCTVSGNSASNGGGLYNNGGALTLGNTIVSKNTATTAPDILGTISNDLGYNLLGAALAGTTSGPGDIFNDTPLLGQLANNGGPTQTMALLAGSQAIDAGNNLLAVDAQGNPLTTDQRGALRGPAGLNAGTAVDIGAYEASSSYLVTSTDDSNDVGTLRAAVGWANVSSNANPANLANPAANTVVFDTAATFATAQIITLTQGQLELSNPSTAEAIIGPGANLLSISGNNASRVFQIDAGASAALSGLTITGGNAGFGNGGGVLNDGTLTLTDCTLSGNSVIFSGVVEVGRGTGGGLYNAGMATLTDCTVSGNVASYGALDDSSQFPGGGGVSNAGTLTLTNCTFSANKAIFGGGLSNDGTATLTDCTLSGNTSTFSGGGIYNRHLGTATLTNCTISGNTAGLRGGGMSNYRGTATLTNCTISGNHAAVNGGGVNNSGSATTTLTNCTVSGNSTSGSGGGLSNLAGTVTLTNTIVANSTGGDIANFGTLTGSNNLVDDGSDGLPDTIVKDPQLTWLGNYGGPTQTMALLYGSPAIDAGTSTGAPPTDQRGLGRVGAVDIGAFESQGFTVSIVAGDNQSTIQSTPFADPLQVSLTANDPIGQVTGAVITYTVNPSVGGAGATLSSATATTRGRAGTASVTATANAVLGSYTVTASAPGASSATFNLTNDETPSLVVTTTSDVVDPTDGLTSLREAIDYAETLSGPQTITFDPTNFDTPKKITLTQGALPLSSDLTITGPGANQLTISGGGNSSIFVSHQKHHHDNDHGGVVEITGLTLSDGNGTNGGAIDNTDNLTLIDCTISGNSAVTGGGIYNDGTLNLTNCTVSGNSAGSNGDWSGGHWGGGSATGGGVYNSGTATLMNCTVSGNSASQGGGLYNAGTVTLTNTIVANSTGGDIANFGTLTGSNNLVDDGTGSSLSNTIDKPAMLGPLANNGGPTQTMALLPGSPAIDHGSNALIPIDPTTGQPYTTDQRGAGFARIVNGTVDIGAFEVQSVATTTTVTPSLAAPVYGQTLTFTAIVSAAGSTPTGSVQFTLDNVAFGSKVPLDASGDATSGSISTLIATGHTIVATYIPTGVFLTNNRGSTTFSVAKAHLTVTANNQTRNFSVANPALTATLSGFVHGEGPGVVSGAATLSTTATVSSPVGTYPITVVSAGTLTAANYDFPSNLFGNGTLTITLPSSGAAAYVLNATANGAVTASGNADVKLPGGLYVDSSSASAINASGNAQVNVGGLVQVVGGVSTSGKASATKTGTPAATSDPLAGLPLPGLSGLTNYGAVSVAGNSSKTLSPGIYTSIQVSGNASVTLSNSGSGIYIIEGGGLSVSGNGSLSGSGVLIFNAGSAYNGTTDGGSYGSITLGGNGTISLSGPTSGPDAGVVIFQSRSNTKALSLGGNGTAGISSTLYASAANAGLSGNATVNGTLVVSTLTVSGNAGAFQLAGGASSDYVASTNNWISNAVLTVAVQDDTGNGIDPNEIARLDDAMSYLNQALGSFGVYLTWAAPGTSADIHVHFASTTPEGDASAGVIGFTTAANDVYFVTTGWSFYTGSDPGAIGSGQYDFLTLATHELAHTVGLGESVDPSSVLYEYLAPGTVRRTFTDSNLSLIDTNADRFMKAAQPAVPATMAAALSNPFTVGTPGLAIGPLPAGPFGWESALWESSASPKDGHVATLTGLDGDDSVLMGGPGSDLVISGQGWNLMAGVFGLDGVAEDHGAGHARDQVFMSFGEHDTMEAKLMDSQFMELSSKK